MADGQLGSVADVLPALRLAVRDLFLVDALGNWALRAPPAKTIRLIVLLESRTPARLALSHPDFGEERVLGQREVLLLPHGDEWVLSPENVSNDRVEALSLADAPREQGPGIATRVRVGDSGPSAGLIVLGFNCENDLGYSLMSALPRVVHVKHDYPDLGIWLSAITREAENRRIGGETVIVRFSEIMVLYAIRYYLEKPDKQLSGWLAALAEPQLGRALAMIHREPARAWSVSELASAAALSRAAFYRKFCATIGEPPLQYLRRWRMQLARAALRQPGVSVLEVAYRVGYDSEAAFSRAFKRHYGSSPSVFRSPFAD